MNKPIVWLVICVAAIGSAGAATFYVDSADGRDDPAWNGGPSDPWRTITYALSRTSGENTFLCRGVFREDVRVTYEERRSTFTAHPEAALEGSVECEYGTDVVLNGFDIYGYAAAGEHSGLIVEGCYFSNPTGPALSVRGCAASAHVYSCVFDKCREVSYGFIDIGTLYFKDCVVKDCEKGITITLDACWTIERCRFENVEGTAVSSYGNGSGDILESEFYNCGTGAGVGNGDYGAWVSIKDSTFIGNTVGITGGTWVPYNSGGITLQRNVVVRNTGNGIEIAGNRIWLRGNVVKDNGGYGVYIKAKTPDLGKPANPGRNTFAGNGSGYDVYNASSEDIPACGNTWDPQSQQEMAGKTWQQVNVARIYDHWDDPSVGYVMWSDFSAVRPASLGRIKASFGEGPATGQVGPGPAAAGER